MSYLYVISVHDESGNTIVSGEGNSAESAATEVFRLERYLAKLKAETDAIVPESESDF